MTSMEISRSVSDIILKKSKVTWSRHWYLDKILELQLRRNLNTDQKMVSSPESL